MSTFSPAVRALLVQRSRGMCELCRRAPGTDAHHRRPKGMGGDKRPDTHAVTNGVWVCSPCHHDRIHAHPAAARADGWMVRQSADPALVPLRDRLGDWFLLTPDGEYLPQERAS